MHIVFHSHEYPLWSPGGVGSFMQTFGRALVRRGHSVTIVGAGKSYEEEFVEDEGVQLYRLPKKKGKLPGFVHNAKKLNAKLKEIHRNNPIDIIEGAEQGLALVSRGFPAKKVIRLHGGHHFFAEAERRGINWRKGLLEKHSFRKADGFIAVSEYVRDHTAKFLSYHNKPVEVINHPMETSISKPVVDIDANRILFAGTVCEKKGARELIQAFKIVKEKYPDKALDLFGRDWFYPNGDSYIETIQKELDPSHFEGVVFHGSIPRDVLNEKYTASAFCVFPSHMETQGLVTLEAMLLEKPVIFSKYGPGPETIAHGETGLLCDALDPQDIAEKMIWCIEHPSEANEMGKKAALKVKEKYDIDRILDKNLAFYNQLK